MVAQSLSAERLMVTWEKSSKRESPSLENRRDENSFFTKRAITLKHYVTKERLIKLYKSKKEQGFKYRVFNYRAIEKEYNYLIVNTIQLMILMKC